MNKRQIFQPYIVCLWRFLKKYLKYHVVLMNLILCIVLWYYCRTPSNQTKQKNKKHWRFNIITCEECSARLHSQNNNVLEIWDKLTQPPHLHVSQYIFVFFTCMVTAREWGASWIDTLSFKKTVPSWLKFIFNKAPDYLTSTFTLRHISVDCFMILSQWNSVFAKRLLLKNAAAWTILDSIANPGHV